MRGGLAVLLLLACASCGSGRLISADDDSETTATNTGSETSPGTEGESTTITTVPTSATEGPPPDTMSGPVQCHPFEQDCPPDEKCVPWSAGGGAWDDSKCVPVLGDNLVGEPCTYGGTFESTDDCDANSFCFDTQEIDGQLIGTCHAFCTGTPRMPECPDGQQCLLSSGPVTLCFPMCDPVAQDCPEDGEGCYWSSTAFVCIEPVGAGVPPGQPCQFATDCEIGSLCLDAGVIPDCGGTGCCGAFCDVGLGDMQCANVPGTSCVAFWEQGMAPEGYDHVGVCVIPP
jgi:hypothetical protein